MLFLRTLICLLILGVCQSCNDETGITLVKVKNEYIEISSERLASGKILYQRFCANCHRDKLGQPSTGPPVGFVLDYRSMDYMKGFLKYPYEIIANREFYSNCVWDKWKPVIKTSIYDQYYGTNALGQNTYLVEQDEPKIDSLIENICYWVQWESGNQSINRDSLSFFYDCDPFEVSKLDGITYTDLDSMNSNYLLEERIELYVSNFDFENDWLSVSYVLPSINVKLAMVRTENSGFIILGSENKSQIRLPEVKGFFEVKLWYGAEAFKLSVRDNINKYYLSYDKKKDQLLELHP